MDSQELRKLANSGDAEAAYKLGMMYERGDGVPQNTAIAIKRYQQAESRGHEMAAEKLAEYRSKHNLKYSVRLKPTDRTKVDSGGNENLVSTEIKEDPRTVRPSPSAKKHQNDPIRVAPLFCPIYGQKSSDGVATLNVTKKKMNVRMRDYRIGKICFEPNYFCFTQTKQEEENQRNLTHEQPFPCPLLSGIKGKEFNYHHVEYIQVREISKDDLENRVPVEKGGFATWTLRTWDIVSILEYLFLKIFFGGKQGFIIRRYMKNWEAFGQNWICTMKIRNLKTELELYGPTFEAVKKGNSLDNPAHQVRGRLNIISDYINND